MGHGTDSKTIDRRGFIRGAAVTAAGIGAASIMGGTALAAGSGSGSASASGSASGTASASGSGSALGVAAGSRTCEPASWDMEADVVVMGYGFAGEASAIAAAATGAQVVMFEKAPEEAAGGNSAVCCGFLNICSGDGAFDAWKAITDGGVSDEECQAVADASTEMPYWFVDNIGSAEVVENTGDDATRTWWGIDYPNASSVGLNIDGKGMEGGGAYLHGLVADVISSDYADAIDVEFASPVTDLVYDADAKEVLGVQFQDADGNVKYCKAKRGVVLAAGGYEGNTEMVTDFVLTHYEQYPIGSPYNTGDAIHMLTRIGAKLRHMAAVEYGAPACLELSRKYNQAIAAFNGGDMTSSVYINQHGVRFMAEDGRWPAHDKRYPYPCFTELKETAETPNYPWWMVFDETRRTAGTLFAWSNAARNEGYAAVRDVYQWSDDNQQEIDDGIVLKADTFEELGKLMGFSDDDNAAFVATMEQFNSDVADGGTDSVFGRGPSTGRDGSVTNVNPLTTPPYYAVQCCLSYLNTNGGPARDANWQAMDWDGNPIGRLYSAGECGSVFYHYYWGGGNVNECFASGMMAGQNAAANEDWA